MMTISLGGKKAHGRVAYVDDAEYDRLMRHRWWIQEDQRPSGGTHGPYARASIRRIDGRAGYVLIFMHNLIMGCTGIDHRNGNGLDNQRHNLRKATGTQNARNQKRQAQVKSSAYKGVSWHRQHQKWCARIMVNRKSRWLGMFLDEISAARAYDIAAIELFGEFARLNFPAKPEAS